MGDEERERKEKLQAEKEIERNKNENRVQARIKWRTKKGKNKRTIPSQTKGKKALQKSEMEKLATIGDKCKKAAYAFPFGFEME